MIISMEETAREPLVKPLTPSSNFSKAIIATLILALLGGITTGYVASKNSGGAAKSLATLGQPPKVASEDTRTFRDFAEGTIRAKPAPADPSQYSEGTHLLEREGTTPVAVTSSVVDLTQYEGKKVKVFGETQKALSEGWLMDVGKVEEVK